ncbi:MAG: hypothetical protein KKE96_03080 [Candidatus Altiarchaeota archaeon]|nr:hypothetical protein [Candidatus Altiarchaeota archaeon]MBU4437386.1 hypothetical protein [Candidatus Altiarchaeota archaeon]
MKIYKLSVIMGMLIILSGQAAAIALAAVPVILAIIRQMLACIVMKAAQSSTNLYILYQFLDNTVINSIKEMLATDSLRDLILFPEPGIIADPVIVNLVEFLTHLMIPFYTLLVASTAFYLLFTSGSIVGRARAKSTLIKLIIAVVVTIFTVPIIQLLLDISRKISHIVLGFADIGLASKLLITTAESFSDDLLYLFLASYWSGFAIFALFSTLAIGMFVILILRFYMIVLWTILFPVTILLYAFHPLRRMGSVMLQQTIQWIFMQVVVSFLLVSIAIGVESLPAHFLANSYFMTALGMVSFSLFIILPFMTMGLMDMMAVVTRFGGIDISTSGLITIVDEMTIEEVGTQEITPPSPVKPF